MFVGTQKLGGPDGHPLLELVMRFLQFLFHFFSVADVPRSSEGGHDISLRIRDGCGIIEDVDVFAVFGLVSVFHVIDRFACYDLSKLLSHFVRIFGMDQCESVDLTHLFFGIAQAFLERLVGKEKVALEIDREQHVGRGFNQ